MGTVINLQITLFGLIAVGFLIKKIGIIGDAGQKNLNDLVLNVVLPCNIFKAFVSIGTTDGFSKYLWILGISLGIQVFCVLYGKLVFRRFPEGERKCAQYATICSNAGFIGNPVAEGIWGAQGLVLAQFYLIPLRIMMWSSGLPMFTGERDWKKQVIKVVTHPCIIACVIGIVFMLLNWKLPSGLMGIVNAIGSCNTGLSMMVVGMILSRIDFRQLWDFRVFLFSIHRLIIIPAVVWLVCRFLPVGPETLGISVILAAMPAGATTSILAVKYDMEPEFATKLVIFSTLMSLPTIALWSMLLG
ncbi:MAG: AEC family transporter [Clostridia bacterium]|nr:AEC family transporter [Clostridia bacterium]